jgi:hypothetical protein
MFSRSVGGHRQKANAPRRSGEHGVGVEAKAKGSKKKSLPSKEQFMELHGNANPPFVVPEGVAEAKTIRIIDGRYNLQFTVADGGAISVDGEAYRLRYCDETHFKAESMETGKSAGFFHICQFGERVIDRGCIVTKMATEAENQQTGE